MRGMDFDDLEAGLARHPGGGGELADDLADFRWLTARADRWRREPTAARSARAEPSRHPRPGSACRLPMAPVEDALRPAWAIWMPGTDAALRDDRRQPGQQRLMLRRVEAQAMRRDAADGGDMRRLGEHDAGAAGRAGAEVLDMPVVPQAVVGAVLAHRRDDDAVAGGDRAEADRLEQQRRWTCGVVSRLSGGPGESGSRARMRWRCAYTRIVITRETRGPEREHPVDPVLGVLRPCRQRQRGVPAAAPGRRGLGDQHRPVLQPHRLWRLERRGLFRPVGA